MAALIKIRRNGSSATAVPTALAEGELAAALAADPVKTFIGTSGGVKELLPDAPYLPLKGGTLIPVNGLTGTGIKASITAAAGAVPNNTGAVEITNNSGAINASGLKVTVGAGQWARGIQINASGNNTIGIEVTASASAWGISVNGGLSRFDTIENFGNVNFRSGTKMFREQVDLVGLPNQTVAPFSFITDMGTVPQATSVDNCFARWILRGSEASVSYSKWPWILGLRSDDHFVLGTGHGPVDANWAFSFDYTTRLGT